MAISTSPTKQQPPEQRDVVTPFDGSRAARASGTMTVESFQLIPQTGLGGKSMDADIQETPDATAQDKEERQDKRSRQVVHHVECSCTVERPVT